MTDRMVMMAKRAAKVVLMDFIGYYTESPVNLQAIFCQRGFTDRAVFRILNLCGVGNKPAPLFCLSCTFKFSCEIFSKLAAKSFRIHYSANYVGQSNH